MFGADPFSEAGIDVSNGAQAFAAEAKSETTSYWARLFEARSVLLAFGGFKGKPSGPRQKRTPGGEAIGWSEEEKLKGNQTFGVGNQSLFGRTHYTGIPGTDSKAGSAQEAHRALQGSLT